MSSMMGPGPSTLAIDCALISRSNSPHSSAARIARPSPTSLPGELEEGFRRRSHRSLAARRGSAIVYVCLLDMDIAKAPPPAVGANGDNVTAPSHNRAVWLVDAFSGETWLLMSGFHDTPGWNDLPPEPVS